MRSVNYYKDSESAISVKVNPEAIKSESQSEAINEFMMNLAGIPTHEELCEWVDGYEELSTIYKELKDILRDAREYGKRIKYDKIHDLQDNNIFKNRVRVETNIKGIRRYMEHDITNRQDVCYIDVIIEDEVI